MPQNKEKIMINESLSPANGGVFSGADQDHNVGVLLDIQSVAQDRAREVFMHPDVHSFFARYQRNPGLALTGEIKQTALSDGTSLMIGENGVIAVTGLRPIESEFSKVSALRQEGSGVGYHDFEMSWEHTRWLWLDIKQIQNFEQLKAKLEEYKQPQP
jgi:hypothetical protein